MFDDYNYESFNKYILIDPNRDETEEDKIDLGNFVPMPVKIHANNKACKKNDNISDD